MYSVLFYPLDSQNDSSFYFFPIGRKILVVVEGYKCRGKKATQPVVLKVQEDGPEEQAGKAESWEYLKWELFEEFNLLRYFFYLGYGNSHMKGLKLYSSFKPFPSFVAILFS